MTQQTQAESMRLARYLDRLSKARGMDKEQIHCFDGGTPSEAVLMASDIRAVLARLQELEAQQSVPGWKLVPVEPTKEMVEAYLALSYGFQSARTDWEAMLAAAPTPPSQQCTCPSGDGSLRWPCPSHPPEPERTPLTDEQIERLRDQTFSTGNPYCPCDSKTMRKAVQAAERAHGIGVETK